MKDFNDDEHIDVCENIEVALKLEYENNPGLTDTLCIFALDNAKIAIKQSFGFAKNERVKTQPNTEGIINSCLEIGKVRIDNVNNLSLKEYLKRIDKVQASVKRHSSFGTRGYYEFIKKYV